MLLRVLTSLLSGGLVDKLLGHLERRADTATERLRIETARRQNADNRLSELAIKNAELSAQVITTAMNFRIFWVAWSIAAFPTVAWYSLGILDSMIMNGTVLPDVAALPPQLLGYANVVMDNIFYSGVGGAATQAIVTAIRGK